MKRFVNASRLLVLGLLILPLLSVPALADYVFEATMTGDQVVSPSGSTGYGMAIMIMNDAMTEVAYTVNFGGLDAPLSSCGFYIGAVGSVGTLVMDLPGGNPMAGIWAIDSTISDALMADEVYVSVFSDAGMFPNGELRGNFSLTTVADEPNSLDSIKALYR